MIDLCVFCFVCLSRCGNIVNVDGGKLCCVGGLLFVRLILCCVCVKCVSELISSSMCLFVLWKCLVIVVVISVDFMCFIVG